MPRVRMMCALAVALLIGAGSAQAATIDFESTPIGVYGPLVIGDATIVYQGGNGAFDIVALAPAAPLVGRTMTSFFQNQGNAAAFRVDFAIPVFSFRVAVGDFNEDEDPVFLEARSITDQIIASDSDLVPGPLVGGLFLEVTSVTPIAYVRFWSGSPFPNSVVWDNLTYNEDAAAVPEPASMVLLGTGLAGLAARLRRRRS